MTPAQIKAKEIFDMYYDGFNFDETYSGSRKQAKQCALITIQEVVKVLEEFGDKTMELQNMDRDFAWWDKVIEELNNL